MNNAIGLGIILSLQDRASAGLQAVRNQLTALHNVSQNMMKQFDEGAKQLMAGIASIAAGAKVFGILNSTFGASITTAADFEQAMARVRAVSGATGKDFERLTKQARDLGRDTQYSATQVANSQELLARAGFKTEEIISAMPQLLYMAGAEGMDLASAVDIVSNTIRGFGLEASDMERIANVLAKTSSMTNTSISTLGESFKKLAPYAKAVDIPLEKAAAMIGVIGDAGIKGEAAGTAVASAIRRLATSPKAVEEALKSLGISAKDAQGNFVQFDTLMERIYEKISGMGNMDQMNILSRIFGGISGGSMLALMNATVSGKLKEKNDELIYNVSDAAKNMYDIMSATLHGAEKRLESASEGMRIAIGNHLLPAYTKAIDLMAQFKSWLTQLIEEHPIIAKAVIGLTTALLGLSGAALIVVGSLASIGGMIKMWPLLKDTIVLALTSIRSQARAAITSLSGLSSSFAKIKVPIVGMIALAAALYYAWQKNLFGIRDMVEAITQGFSMALNASADGIVEVNDELAEKLKAAGIWDFALIMGRVFFRIREFWNGLVEGFKDGINTLMSAVDWLKSIFSPVVESGQELLKFLGILQPVAETQADTWKEWGKLLGQIAPFVIGVIAAFKGMRIISFIFGNVGKAILGVFSLIAAHPVVAAVIALIAAGIYVYKYWEQISTFFVNLWNKIPDWGKAILMLINPIITLVAAVILAGKYIYSNWEEISASMSEKWQKFTELCAKAADWVKRKWQAFKSWWNSWTLKDLFAPLVDWATSAWNYVKRKWNDFTVWWDSLTIANIFKALEEYIDKAIAYIRTKWTDFTDWLASLNPFASWKAPLPEILKAQEAAMRASPQGQAAQTITDRYAKAYGYTKPPAENAKGGIINSPIVPLNLLPSSEFTRLTQPLTVTPQWAKGMAELNARTGLNLDIPAIQNPIVTDTYYNLNDVRDILASSVGSAMAFAVADLAKQLASSEGSAGEVMPYLKQSQAPSSPLLIQHTQNQAAMAGQATVQAQAEAPEKPVKVNNKVEVKVESKPVDFYIDGEKVGSAALRWVERQNIRSGVSAF